MVQGQEEQKVKPALPTTEMIAKENPATINANELKTVHDDKSKTEQTSPQQEIKLKPMVKATSAPVLGSEENKSLDPSSRQSKENTQYSMENADAKQLTLPAGVKKSTEPVVTPEVKKPDVEKKADEKVKNKTRPGQH
jgi:hypothetical protein